MVQKQSFYMDVDIVYLKTDYIYKDIAENIEIGFDTFLWLSLPIVSNSHHLPWGLLQICKIFAANIIPTLPLKPM